jgi:hypothetical protein
MRPAKARFIARMKDWGAISMWWPEALMISAADTGMTSLTNSLDSIGVIERLQRR